MKGELSIKYNNWLRYLIALMIIIIVVLTTNRIVSKLKKDEQQKVYNYATALEILNGENNIPTKTQLFLVSLIEQNKDIPVVLVDSKDNIIDAKNVDAKNLRNKELQQKELYRMKKLYPPITITLPFEKQYIYYKNSILLNKLEYYPIILILIIVLYVSFTIWYFRSIKKTEQSLLWVGMSKETAHQIGTPLSSIMGWIEILKLEDVNPKAIKNIERDVDRLKSITDRFSKIGSTPKLVSEDINEITKKSFNYLRKRVSKNIEFVFNSEDKPINILINNTLYSWVIENMVKNAVDAMKDKEIGEINLQISENNKYVYVDIEDQGHGVAKKNIKRLFQPGFTTKTRGWGLGLSLAKRIIVDYHHGKIYVLKSELGKGTTFRIVLKK